MLYLHFSCFNDYGMYPIQRLKFVCECEGELTEAIEKAKILAREFKLVQTREQDWIRENSLQFSYKFELEKIKDSQENVLWNRNKNFLENSESKLKETDAIRGELSNTYGQYLVNFHIRTFDNNVEDYYSVICAANYPLEAIRKAAKAISEKRFIVGEYIVQPTYVFDLETDYIWEPELLDEPGLSNAEQPINWVQRFVRDSRLLLEKVDYEIDDYNIDEKQSPENEVLDFVIGITLFFSKDNSLFQEPITFERVYTPSSKELTMEEVWFTAEKMSKNLSQLFYTNGYYKNEGLGSVERVEVTYIYREDNVLVSGKVPEKKAESLLENIEKCYYEVVYQLELDSTEFNLTAKTFHYDLVEAIQFAQELEEFLDKYLDIELTSVRLAGGEIFWSKHF
jgi:hypothetical protein